MSFWQSVQSYQQQILQSRQAQGEGHPDLKVLRAYHHASLSADEADRIQEHLATCPECGQLFLGLVHFLEWNLDPHRLSVEDLTRAWESFRQRRERGSTTADPVEELCPVTQD